MSKLNDLIKEMCPNGVEYKKVWQITTWDKKYNSVDKYMQPKIIKYNYLLANQLNEIIVDNGDVFILETGINNTKKYTNEDLAGDNLCNGEIIAIPWGGTPNVKYYNGKFVTGDNRIAVSNDINVLNTKFLYYIFENKMNEIADFYRGSGIKHPEMKKVLNLDIPVPPIKVQEEIVKILDKFSKLEAELEAELEARKSQYEFWREKLLNTGNSNQEYITLGDIGKVCMCKRIMKNETSDSGDVPFYKIGTFGKQADAYISYDIFNDYKKRFSYPKKGEILVSCSGTIGRSVVFDGEDAYFQDSNIVWLSNGESKVLNKFLYYFYQTSPWNISDGGTIKRLYNNQFISAKVPLYSLEEQKKIVNILERFDKLINDITVGLPAEIELRRKQYEYYRNKLLSFEEN